MSCIIASNQPIYQALLEKAKSYPEDKVYQKKAYENAAKNLLTHQYNIYKGDGQAIPGVGESITNFIKEFIKTEVFPSGNEKSAKDAMEEARRLAAQNAPKVEPEQKPEPEQKYTQNAMKDVHSVTLPGPPLTTTITYITIETTHSIDDIMKCIRAINESVTSNPPK